MRVRTEEPAVFLICGALFSKQRYVEAVEGTLEKEFGPLYNCTDMLAFDHTSYYASEMGKHLLRRYYAFDRLIVKPALADIKIKTNAIEEMLSVDGKRRVNLDPGYLDLAKLVLASAKDFSHRIYIGKGIYAEVTFMFRDGGCHFLPWTYPDYREVVSQEFFLNVRKEYHRRMKEGGTDGT